MHLPGSKFESVTLPEAQGFRAYVVDRQGRIAWCAGESFQDRTEARQRASDALRDIEAGLIRPARPVVQVRA